MTCDITRPTIAFLPNIISHTSALLDISKLILPEKQNWAGKNVTSLYSRLVKCKFLDLIQQNTQAIINNNFCYAYLTQKVPEKFFEFSKLSV